MVELQVIIDRVVGCLSLGRQYMAPEWNPPVDIVAGILLIASLLSILWGARLLRMIYILTFIVSGASLGVWLAKRFDVELLIGLVLGAGVLGVLGHLLYRWWIGMTAGICAATVVIAMGLPWIWDYTEQFSDHYMGSARGLRFAGCASRAGQTDSNTPGAGQNWLAPPGFWDAYRKQLWEQRQMELQRVAILAAIAAGLGLIMGLILTRFTTLLGTALIGTLIAAISAGFLLLRYRPDWWASFTPHSQWSWIVIGGLTLSGMAFQWRYRRSRTPSHVSHPSAESAA